MAKEKRHEEEGIGMAEKKKEHKCRHWAYSRSLQGNAMGSWIQRICRGCGRTENVELGPLPGDDFKAVWKRFHGG